MLTARPGCSGGMTDEELFEQVYESVLSQVLSDGKATVNCNGFSAVLDFTSEGDE